MSLSVSGFVFSFPLMEACCKNDTVLHGKSIISTWLKCNPLSLHGPEPSKLLTDPEDSLLIHLGPAKEVLRQITPPLPFLFLPAERTVEPGQLPRMHFKGLEDAKNNLNCPLCLLLLI